MSITVDFFLDVPLQKSLSLQQRRRAHPVTLYLRGFDEQFRNSSSIMGTQLPAEQVRITEGYRGVD